MSETSTTLVVNTKNRYAELVGILKKEGYFKRKPRRILTELFIHLTTGLTAMAVFIFSDNIWIQLGSLFLMTYGTLGVATNTHTSSHYATSDAIWLNRFLTYFGYPFMLGMSAHSWWNRHCIVHHPNPNIIGVDDDVDLRPTFAIDEEKVINSKGLRRSIYNIQWVFFPFLLALNSFNVQYSGWVYLLSLLKNKKQRNLSHWIDLGALIGHYVLWIGIPLLYFPAVDIILFYILRKVLMSYALFVAFAPAHFPDDAAFLHTATMKQKEDFIFRQSATTLNFRTRLFGRFVCSGVDYQIEHHLFPRIPHFYYPKLSPVIQKFCQQHGYPYRTLKWREAIWKSAFVFYRPKKIFDSLSILREQLG